MDRITLSPAGNVFVGACIRGLIPAVPPCFTISAAAVYIDSKKDPTGSAIRWDPI